MSNSSWPHRLQHARLPCPSPIPGTCSNSCPSSQRCHPTISSSVVPFSCLQSFPASGSFPVSQFFVSGVQSIRTSASASVISMNIRTYFLQDWLVWSPCSPRDSQESSTAPQFKSINSLALSRDLRWALLPRRAGVDPTLWAGVQWSWSGPLILASSGATPWLAWQLGLNSFAQRSCALVTANYK